MNEDLREYEEQQLSIERWVAEELDIIDDNQPEYSWFYTD